MSAPYQLFMDEQLAEYRKIIQADDLVIKQQDNLLNLYKEQIEKDTLMIEIYEKQIAIYQSMGLWARLMVGFK